MAKAPRTIEGKLTRLTRIVEKGFAAIAEDIARRPTNSSVAGIIENYVPGLVRKALREEIPGIVREEVRDIRKEVASIRRDVGGLKEMFANLTGLTKEIDHALDRIRVIEKHLGLESDISA